MPQGGPAPETKKNTTKQSIGALTTPPAQQSVDVFQALAELERQVNLREAVREHTIKVIETGVQPYKRVPFPNRTFPGLRTETGIPGSNYYQAINRASKDNSLINQEEKTTIDAWQRATRIASQFRQAFNFLLTDDLNVVSALTKLQSDKEAAELVGRVYKFRYNSDLETDLKKRSGSLGGLSEKAFNGNIPALCAASIFVSLNSTFSNPEQVINLYRGLTAEQRKEIETQLSAVVKQTPFKTLDEFYQKSIPSIFRERFNAVRNGDSELERVKRFLHQFDRISFSPEKKNVTSQLDELARLSTKDILGTLKVGQKDDLLGKLSNGVSIANGEAVKRLLAGEPAQYIIERIKIELDKARAGDDKGIYDFLAALPKESKKLIGDEVRSTTGKFIMQAFDFSGLTQAQDNVIRNYMSVYEPGEYHQMIAALRRNASEYEIAQIIVDAVSKGNLYQFGTPFQSLMGKSLSSYLKEHLKSPEYADLIESVRFSERMSLAKTYTPSLGLGVPRVNPMDKIIDEMNSSIAALKSGFKTVDNIVTSNLGDEIPASRIRWEAFSKILREGRFTSDTEMFTRMYQLAHLDLNLARMERDRIAEDIGNKAQTTVSVASLFLTDGLSAPLFSRQMAKTVATITAASAATNISLKSLIGKEVKWKEEGIDFGMEFLATYAGMTVYRGSRLLRAKSFTQIATEQLENEGRRITQQSIAGRVAILQVRERPVIRLAWSAANGFGAGAAQGVNQAVQTFRDAGLDITKDPVSFGAIILEESLKGAGVSTFLELRRLLPKIRYEFRRVESQNNRHSVEIKITKESTPTLESEYPTLSATAEPVSTRPVKKIKLPKPPKVREQPVSPDKVEEKTPAPGILSPSESPPAPKVTSGDAGKSPAKDPIASLAPAEPKVALPSQVTPEISDVAPAVSPEAVPEKKVRRPRIRPSVRNDEVRRATVIPQNVNTEPEAIRSFTYDDSIVQRVHRDSRNIIAKLLKGEGLDGREPEGLFGATQDSIGRTVKGIFGSKSPADIAKIFPSLEKLEQFSEPGLTCYSIKPSGAGKPSRVVFFWGEAGPEGIRISRHYEDH